MKRKVFQLILIFIIEGCLSSNAFRLESSFSDSIVPVCTVQEDENGVTVSYDFPGAVAMQDDLYPNATLLTIPDFGHNSTLGEPNWPFHIDSFEIPEGFEANMSVISEVWKDMDLSLSPVRPMLSDSGNDSYNLSNVPPINECIYPLPESPVSISNIGNYRDRNILFVNIIPVKYVNSDMIKVCEKLIYRIDFKRSKNVLKFNSKIRHDVDTDFMAALYTYSLSESKEDQIKIVGNGKWRTAPHYLILSIPDYSDSINY